MAVTAAQIIAEFPEFADVPTADIDFKLADAVGRINATIWGALTDQGVKYLTCHLLAVSPLGEQAKLETEDGQTVYFQTYKRLMASVSSGCRVI